MCTHQGLSAYIHGYDVHTLVCPWAQSNLTQWESDLNPKLSILSLELQLPNFWNTLTLLKEVHSKGKSAIMYWWLETQACEVKKDGWECARTFPEECLPQRGKTNEVLQELLQRFSLPIFILYNTFQSPLWSVFRIVRLKILGYPRPCWKFKFRTL